MVNGYEDVPNQNIGCGNKAPTTEGGIVIVRIMVQATARSWVALVQAPLFFDQSLQEDGKDNAVEKECTRR
jgi:hypothetical protein